MMRPSTRRMMLMLVVLFLAITGCGGPERPDMVPVSGVVLDKDGKPVVGAQVIFKNGKAPREAQGTTDNEGKFRLTSFEDFDGAIIGEHKVAVTKIQGDAALDGADVDDPSAAYGDGMLAAAEGNMEAIQKNELNPKYADPETSGLTETVTEQGPNEFEIKLE